MKKKNFAILCFFALLILGTLTSCFKTPLYYVMSNGILTYNRQTGQLELLWEYNGGGDSLRTDTIRK